MGQIAVGIVLPIRISRDRLMARVFHDPSQKSRHNKKGTARYAVTAHRHSTRENGNALKEAAQLQVFTEEC